MYYLLEFCDESEMHAALSAVSADIPTSPIGTIIVRGALGAPVGYDGVDEDGEPIPAYDGYHCELICDVVPYGLAGYVI